MRRAARGAGRSGGERCGELQPHLAGGGEGEARRQTRAAALDWPLVSQPDTGRGASHTFPFSPPSSLVVGYDYLQMMKQRHEAAILPTLGWEASV